MAKRPSQDERLTRVTRIALELPGASVERHGSHSAYLVGKKKFAYYLDNHHGDGIVGITCKVFPGENKSLTEAQPKRFYMPAYLASRGWVALRLDVGKIDWNEVRDLLACSFQLVAPKKLADRTKPSVG